MIESAPLWLWIGFILSVIVLLVLDLSIFHKTPHKISYKEAIWVSLFWIGLALGFNLWFSFEFGGQLGLEFLTGYLVEKSLSVDNLFVILLIFAALKIPEENQHRVLFWGVMGAIVMRGVLIVVGAKLVQKFDWILYIFGGILIVTAVRFLRDKEEQVHVAEHWSIKVVQKFYPVTPHIHGGRFFYPENGVKKATPLLLALIMIEISDLVFAVDSIPAVFAVTKHPFVAFASNILAILGLRSLFFVIAKGVSKLKYLKPGLAIILGYVGTKMIIVKWFHIPSWVSLVVISFVLLTAGLSSWYVSFVNEKKKGQS